MNIKEASARTGLTKKAIKYYESEGLIHPEKNPENNYREFSKEDIIKLNLIGALRNLDISTKNIKNVMDGVKTIPEIMKEKLEKIQNEMVSLENTKSVVQSFLEKEFCDYKNIEDIGSSINKLNKSLELSIEDKKEYIGEAIMRTFPGSFGKMFVANYGAFLDIRISNGEKRKTWLDMVEFLDNLEEAEEDHPFIKMIDTMGEEALDEFIKNKNKFVKSILEKDKKTIKEVKEANVKFLKSLRDDKNFRDSYMDNLKKGADLMNSVGGKGNQFDLYLEKLNDDYRKFREIARGILSEAEMETGTKLSELLTYIET
ncbi:MerR family transcriptional regulator [Clostridium sp. KNHs214]|uniref:MerR family transcriptional regulator n=1 Tax=Clostridium sp. KNHs214 TaxID=1540257 RepID=UPI0009E0AA9B|nr:MerR family transcriptional regulator [Clostridium sp. KNHs214]